MLRIKCFRLIWVRAVGWIEWFYVSEISTDNFFSSLSDLKFKWGRGIGPWITLTAEVYLAKAITERSRNQPTWPDSVTWVWARGRGQEWMWSRRVGNVLPAVPSPPKVKYCLILCGDLVGWFDLHWKLVMRDFKERRFVNENLSFSFILSYSPFLFYGTKKKTRISWLNKKDLLLTQPAASLRFIYIWTQKWNWWKMTVSMLWFDIIESKIKSQTSLTGFSIS